MALPKGRTGREFKKFVEDSNGDVALRAKITDFDGDMNINVENNSVSTTGLVGKASGNNADFDADYTSATTLTLSNFPAGLSSVYDEDIVSITQVATDGSVTKIWFRDDTTMSVTTNVVTVTGAVFVNTDTFIVMTNIPRASINDSVHAEDAAHVTGDMGSFGLSVRADSAASTAGADGDYAGFITDATGQLYTVDEAGNTLLGTIDADTDAIKTAVELIDNASTTIGTTDVQRVAIFNADNTQITEFGGADVDDSAFTVASDKGTVSMAVVTSDEVDDGDKGALSMTTDRKLRTGGYDDTLQTQQVSNTNPVYNQFSDVNEIVSEQDLTDTYTDFGSEISMEGYNRLGVFIVSDANNSEDVDLKVLGLMTAGGSDEFEIDGLSVETLWSGAGSDSKVYYEFDVGTVPFVQLQAIAGTVGGTAGDLTISINKKWRA